MVIDDRNQSKLPSTERNVLGSIKVMGETGGATLEGLKLTGPRFPFFAWDGEAAPWAPGSPGTQESGGLISSVSALMLPRKGTSHPAFLPT